MKRFFIAVFLATALAIPAASAAPQQHVVAQAGACGTDRWTVKTLQDRPRLLANQMRTVRWLVHRKPPAHRTETRMAFEYHVFTVTAQVTAVHLEGDSDYHILLKEHGWPMIAESPAPYCTGRAKLYYRNRMAQARQAVRVCSQARITGVAFFDTEHGQPGVAPNAIELHPVFRFRCLR